MKHLIFCFCILLSLGSYSCRKEIIVPEESFKGLFGKWEWIESSGGIAGTTITPETEGYVRTLEYTDDGIFRQFKDGKKTEQCHYYFEEDESIMAPGKVWLIKYEDGKSGGARVSHYFQLNGKTLTLMDECYDCYVSLYEKE